MYEKIDYILRAELKSQHFMGGVRKPGAFVLQ